MSSAKTRQLAERRVGTTLDGKWRLDALLGFGGSAAVYGATHRNGKRAAVKILHPQCVADEQLRTRFVREGYVANKIGHGAVSVLDDDTAADGTVYIVMELLEGTSLERRGRGDLPPMTLPEVLRVTDELLTVLATAHAAGIVHRDIKPANLFVTTAGELKVLDFGIARLAEPALEGTTQTGLMMGTPAFMSPEQARARWDQVDGRSDLWAVGATMIALLLGRRPRMAETANEELLLAMTQPLAPAATLISGLPLDIAAFIDRAVAFQREDRYADAQAMRAALHAAAGIGPNERFSTPLSAGSMTAELPIVQHTVVTGPQPPTSGPPPPATPMPYLGPPSSYFPDYPPPAFASAPPTSRHSHHDAESPSTASSALSRSHGPQPMPAGRSGTPIAVALAAIAVLGVLAGALYIRSRHPAATTEPAAAAPVPVVSAVAAPVSVGLPAAVAPAPGSAGAPLPAEPPAPPASPASAAASAAPSAAGSVRREPARRPAASANPSKYFDSRF